MPAHHRRAPAVPQRRGPSAALVNGFLLIAVLLCALAHGPSVEAHGPSDEPSHRSSAPTVLVSAGSAGSAGSALTLAAPAAPHGPHGHHAAEECPAGGLPRTPTAQAGFPPPAVAGPALLLAGITGVVPVPPGPTRRRPQRRRRCRAGRTVLVRTARWRT
ncbi:hypothetical protein ACF090_09705 [Streptomyces sp. NPDC014892]|uniref:hypothetical protein n=1 Tax=Streptomyces sp. NPDC014892 TaxID=3364930 RepID=UPI0036FF3E04